MKQTKKRFLYATYLIAATAFFIYTLFPSDTVKTYIAATLMRISPGFTLVIDSIRPAFPPGVKLLKVNLFHSDYPVFETPKMTITADLLSLFQPKKIIRFNTRTYGGEMAGKAEIAGDESAREETIHLNLSDIQINDIPAIRKRSDFKLSGSLYGTIEYRNRRGAASVAAKLNLSTCQLTLMAFPVQLDDLIFNQIETELDMNNQSLKIIQCTAKGPDLDATLSGTVLLKRQIEESALNLNGKMTFHPLFLANLSKKLPVTSLFKNRSGTSQVPIRIRGTLKQPVFELR